MACYPGDGDRVGWLVESVAEGVTVPHFTDPTPVPVENELLFWSDCTI